MGLYYKCRVKETCKEGCMKNTMFLVLGLVAIIFGCIRNEYKKSGLNVVLVIGGLVSAIYYCLPN